MTSTILSYILVMLGVICFILPSWQVVYNKKKNGLKSITKIGKWIIAVSVLLVITGIWNINQKISDDKAIRDDLTDSFTIALKRINPNLKYDPKNNKVSNYIITGVSGGIVGIGDNNTTANNIVGVDMNGMSGSRNINNKPSMSSIINFYELYAVIKDVKEKYGINNNNLQVLYLKNTNGIFYKDEIREELVKDGYVLIGEATVNKNFINLYRNSGIGVSLFKGETTLVIGNLY